MAVQPGWYQDPEGPAGQPRYWDGSRWAPRHGGAVTSHPRGAMTGRRVWTGPLVIVAVVGLLVGFGYLLLPEVLTPGDATPEFGEDPWQVTRSPVAPTDGRFEVGELNCVAAGSANLPKGPELRVAGIVVPFPDERWGFRFENSQWPWLHDLHAWGSIDIEPRGEAWAAGIVAGRLDASDGFGEPQQAAAAVVECLVTHGPFNTGEQMVDATSEAVTVGGMAGWSMTMSYPEEGAYGATVVKVLTIDSGQPGSLAAVIGFYPLGELESETIVLDALDGIRRQ
ncbi:DUF2510 domain-containing protein [Tessaracoccus sp. OS52]|uniref:DUF2510 domain-containing protein n=1 Tax=Tessaracoccus sp. OS52 TaxID=2886691 RepID=UPI001D1289EC|nr:DUF2510 domain-containing protein [Tessaracoccus sp. OS52]MCC2592196.1 DUF2510 domain-containing protein [Tessaracoccus sp. OS52]